MSVLSSYEPKEVLRFFEEICAIPHGSGNVDRISDYLVSFAKARNLKFRQDEKKNVIIWAPGSHGYENSAPVIMQGHMDMVAVKEADCQKDMETEGLDLEVTPPADSDEETYITAKGTSLGGDDGIAVAYALAVMDSQTLAHPPIEAVFTVDEETGMYGASFLDTSDLAGRILLNIDSEDEGILTVSCAGGMRSAISLPIEREAASDGLLLKLSVEGLKGGHSGVEINQGRLNSNLVLGRLLYAVKNLGIRLQTISGGEKDNAIASSSCALILVPSQYSLECQKLLNEKYEEIKNEYQKAEPDFSISLKEVALEEAALYFTTESTSRVISLLMTLPDGVRRMNPDMTDMVQTSLNLGVLSTEADRVVLTSSLRSSSESEKFYLYQQLESLAALAGASITMAGNYPGWEYAPVSRLRDTIVTVYRDQYGEDPVVMGIHAGLECGIFASKLPGLDCVSIGPQMHDIHSPREVLSIESTQRTWLLICSVLAELK